jgi:hypothetical protein
MEAHSHPTPTYIISTSFYFLHCIEFGVHVQTDSFGVGNIGRARDALLLICRHEQEHRGTAIKKDYPYDSIAELRYWFKTVPVSNGTWKNLGCRNAIRLFEFLSDDT